jgi:proline iminopeptidase
VEEHDVPLSDGATLWTCSAEDPDRPPLVLLHGGPGLWDYLGPLADLARGAFRTHRYDQRGCGRSSPSPDHRMARWVADLDELREHFGYETWFVLGHSFGATLGLRYAATYPDRVAGLIYLSGVGLDWPAHKPAFRDRAIARRSPDQHARLVELDGAERTWDEEVEWRRLSWLPDFVDPAEADRFAAAASAPRLPINYACSRALNDEMDAWTPAEERAWCARVTTDVLVAHGTEDPRPVDGVRDLVGSLPSATLTEIEGAGHHPWVERPDAVRALLDRLRAP